MGYTKLSVTVEEHVAEELRTLVGRRRISAFVNDAISQRLQALRVRPLLDDREREHGPIPDSVKAEVDAIEWPE